MPFFEFGVAFFGTQPHEAFVYGKTVQPGVKSAFTAEVLDLAGNGYKNVHQDIFGFVAILEHSESEVQYIGTVGFPQQAKRVAVALLNFLYDDFFVHFVIFDAWGLRVVAWVVKFFF